jgi:hypothetical protein
MMGVEGTPARLFHDFCLEEHVPADHMLRLGVFALGFTGARIVGFPLGLAQRRAVTG